MVKMSPDSKTCWRGDLHMNRLVTKNHSATLLVTTDRLVLDAPLNRHFVLARSQIKAVRQASGRFWRWSWPLKNAIWIEHTSSQVPQVLVFRSSHVSAQQMLEELASFEYKVELKKPVDDHGGSR